jgi:hypothetical protein
LIRQANSCCLSGSSSLSAYRAGKDKMAVAKMAVAMPLVPISAVISPLYVF